MISHQLFSAFFLLLLCPFLLTSAQNAKAICRQVEDHLAEDLDICYEHSRHTRNIEGRDCIRNVTTFIRSEKQTCKMSKRDIRSGLDPFSRVTTINGTDYSFVYDMDCIRELRLRRMHAKRECKQAICPDGYYYVKSNNQNPAGCFNANTSQILTVASVEERALSLQNSQKPLPSELIQGFFKWIWSSDTSYQGPKNTNIGVTFTGSFPNNAGLPSGNIAPMTTEGLKILCYGGGNEAGGWNTAHIADISAQSNINFLIDNGYDGVMFDIEQYDSSTTNIPPSTFNGMFQTIKDANLYVFVTISHFAPYGMENAEDLVENWLQNSLIDYLIPQLYTTGYELSNDFTNFNSAFLSSVPKIAPAIVSEPLYSVTYETVTSKLPNSKGFFVWNNVHDQAGPGPSSQHSCVSSTFNGVGCSQMCNWCEKQLGTANYFWESNVCTWNDMSNSCVGAGPLANTIYKCCRQ